MYKHMHVYEYIKKYDGLFKDLFCFYFDARTMFLVRCLGTPTASGNIMLKCGDVLGCIIMTTANVLTLLPADTDRKWTPARFMGRRNSEV